MAEKISLYIKSGILWFQKHLSQRQFLLFSSILIGLTSGLAAIVLKTFVHTIYSNIVLTGLAKTKYLIPAFPLMGILITIWIVKKLLNDKLEKGLWHIHDSITTKSGKVAKEQMYSQLITSSVTVGFGGSAGLEAPIAITGAAIGSNYSIIYKLKPEDRNMLLACGVAAGIAAAFNAPIAGVLFALEVLLVNINISAFTPVILSAATGALLSKIILKDDILLSFQLQQPFNYYNMPFYVLLGILSGIISVYHSRAFMKSALLFGSKESSIIPKAIAGGIALALLVFVFPSLYGEGYQSIKILALQKPELLLKHSIMGSYMSNPWRVLLMMCIIMFMKPLATGITLGSGGNGGNFAPSLFTGAYLGYSFSHFFCLAGIVQLPESNFTIVGMAGILSGIYHAPLTAIFLIAEITGGYTLMIPLMIVASVSFAISKYFEPNSMDTKKVFR